MMVEAKACLPADLHERARDRAVEDDRSLSGLLRVALRAYLGQASTPTGLEWRSFGRRSHVVRVLWGDEAEALCGWTGLLADPDNDAAACSRCRDQLTKALAAAP